MRSVIVRIYERVNSADMWPTVPITIPKLKKDGTLFLLGIPHLVVPPPHEGMAAG